MKKRICCGLLAALLLLLPVKAQAEEAASCTLTCDRTDELYSELVVSGKLAEKYEEMQDRFNFSYNTASDGTSGYDVTYIQVENVTVEVDGTSVSLQEALTEGQITVEQLRADACRDAEAGLCQESFDSSKGVSCFTYAYSDWELSFTDDVLEAPNGSSYRIRSLAVCAPGQAANLTPVYYDMSSPFHYELDREDWGLEFTVSQVDNEGILLNTTQSGGQQFGTLSIFSYMVYDSDFQPVISTVSLDASIAMGTTGSLAIDWNELSDSLTSGDYYLCLRVIDNYDEADVHPLAQNFHDWQNYFVEFSVA